MRVPALVVVLISALLVAGCGGGEVAYTEVKSAPPSLPIPQDQGTAATQQDASPADTDSSDGVTTKKTDDTATSGTTTGTTTTPSTSTGTTTAPSTSTGTTPTTPTTPSTGTSTGGTTPTTPTTPSTGTSGDGTGGASPDTSDQFCADNPGACNGN